MPVLITNIQQIAGLGTGTIPAALRGIYNQVNATCIVVRIEDGDTIEETIINAGGDIVSFTGAYALLKANSTVFKKPKIIICPYLTGILSEDDKPTSLVSHLTKVAEKLKGVAIIDGPNTTRQEAIAFANSIGSSSVYVVDPSYKPDFVYAPSLLSSSSIAAGVMAATDAKYGFGIRLLIKKLREYWEQVAL